MQDYRSYKYCLSGTLDSPLKCSCILGVWYDDFILFLAAISVRIEVTHTVSEKSVLLKLPNSFLRLFDLTRFSFDSLQQLFCLCFLFTLTLYIFCRLLQSFNFTFLLTNQTLILPRSSLRFLTQPSNLLFLQDSFF